MLRDTDGRKGIKIQRQAAGQRRLPDLQSGVRVTLPHGKLAERGQHGGVDALIGEIAT